jgi:CRP-like cAMP-binding protein
MSSDPFVEFAVGDVVLHEGEPATALYIIESGHVTVFRADAPEQALAMLGPGDFFGETALLDQQAHVASVRAETGLRALRLEVASLHGVLRENVDIAVQLLRRLARRLLLAEQGSVLPACTDRLATPPTADALPANQAIALLLRHCAGEIAVAAGRSELLIGRPDPASGANPDIDLGGIDLARTLSRRHARLLLADGRWLLCEEPGVGNGTWLNDERLQPGQLAPVKAGDRLRFGAIEIELVRD